MSYKMFVSYSSKDVVRIDPILSSLRSFPNLECYFFEQSNEPGQDTRDNILTELLLAKTNLLLLPI